MARIGSLAQELPYVLGGSEKEQKTKNNRHPKSDCTYRLPSDRCPPKHFMDPHVNSADPEYGLRGGLLSDPISQMRQRASLWSSGRCPLMGL